MLSFLSFKSPLFSMIKRINQVRFFFSIFYIFCNKIFTTIIFLELSCQSYIHLNVNESLFPLFSQLRLFCVRLYNSFRYSRHIQLSYRDIYIYSVNCRSLHLSPSATLASQVYCVNSRAPITQPNIPQSTSP